MKKFIITITILSTLLASTYCVDCSAKVIISQTGTDGNCNGNQHYWPTTYAPEQCHGWATQDQNGKWHENSANNMRCNSDGSFTFDQYGGTLTCEGNGIPVTKTLLNKSLGDENYPCSADEPPPLYTGAVDLTCCTNPSSKLCKTQIPTTTAGSDPVEIYLDGQLCDSESSFIQSRANKKSNKMKNTRHARERESSESYLQSNSRKTHVSTGKSRNISNSRKNKKRLRRNSREENYDDEAYRPDEGRDYDSDEFGDDEDDTDEDEEDDDEFSEDNEDELSNNAKEEF